MPLPQNVLNILGVGDHANSIYLVHKQSHMAGRTTAKATYSRYHKKQ